MDALPATGDVTFDFTATLAEYFASVPPEK